jgi:phosphorylcholine metabolism protein LicD
MSLNAHGNMTTSNKEQLIANCKRYHPHRLRLALVVQQMLREFGLDFFLDGGSLMGAYRDGKVIQHDDDWDFALFSDIQPESCAAFLSVLCARANQWLDNHDGQIIPNRIEVMP